MATVSSADKNSSQRSDDALARGYLAASKANVPEALSYFSKAASYAEKDRDWQALIDAGNAFSALGKPKKALGPFERAYHVAYTEKDWRGLVALGYSYASLPDNLSGKKKAVAALKSAFKVSRSKKDWRGLYESARAFLSIGEKAWVKKVLSSSRKTVISSGSRLAPSSFAQLAAKIDDKRLRDMYSGIANKPLSSAESSPPPKGWSAYGESVAGPGKIDIDAQIAMRKSVDKEIARTMSQITKVREKEKQRFDYYIAYRDYYSYPYYNNYYDTWHTLNPAQINDWSGHHFSRYRLINGYYVYER